MIEVKEIVKLANLSGVEMTIFDLEYLKTGLYQSCVCAAYDKKIDLEKISRENGLNIDLMHIVHEMFISTGILSEKLK